VTNPQGSDETSREVGRLWLDRGLAIAAALSPLVVALVAGIFSKAITERNTRVELLKLSVGILQAPVTDSSRALRTWGVRQLARYSDVDLPLELQKALADSIRLPAGETPVPPEESGPTRNVTCVMAASSLRPGVTSQAAAVAVDATGGVLTGRRVAWSSSDSSVATVSTRGQVTAVRPGSAIIRAIVDGWSSDCQIIVVPR
jgi:hypothetical protein